MKHCQEMQSDLFYYKMVTYRYTSNDISLLIEITKSSFCSVHTYLLGEGKSTLYSRLDSATQRLFLMI